MSIEVAVVVEDEYLCLRCTGLCSPAEVKMLISRTVDAVLEHRKSRVLIDANGVTGDLSTMERFDCSVFLAEEINLRALGKLAKITVVAKEPPLDPQRFGETVAVNRGVNVKAFTVLDEAIAWLNQ